MRLVLDDGDIKRLPTELRNALMEIVFGNAETEESNNVVGINQYSDTVISAPVTLDDTALGILWDGVNEAGRTIIRFIHDNCGSATAQELMQVVGASSPRQLNGPMGGISRKLRSMFGGEVVLWSYDKVAQRYTITCGMHRELHEFLMGRDFDDAWDKEYTRMLESGQIQVPSPEELDKYIENMFENYEEPPEVTARKTARKAYETGRGVEVNPDLVVSRSKKEGG
jgi:hypothetical protein